jgi:hypothetical protein
MDWISKIIDWVKLPFGFVATATSIMSGALLLLPDDVLSRLSLLPLRTKYGEKIGVIFIVSIGFLLAYILFRAPASIKRAIGRARMNHFPEKILQKLNSVERGLIFAVYNSPNHTRVLNYNDPVVKSMVARRMLFSGGSQFISYDVFTDSYNTPYTLQPFVQRGIERMYDQLERKIANLEHQLKHTLKESRKAELEEELRDSQAVLNNWRSQ